MTLPGWPPRDWRALLALAASIAGSAVLTALVAWIVWILWKGGWPVSTAEARVAALAKAMLGAMIIIGAVLLSLGLAINRRTLKLSRTGGLEMSGGDDSPPSNDKIAAAAAGAAAGAVAAAAEEQTNVRT